MILYEQKKIKELLVEENPIKSRSMNHLISSLYSFMTNNNFSIEEKSVSLSTAIPTIYHSLENHISMERCKETLWSRFQSESDTFIKVSPILKRHQAAMVLK